MKLNNIDRLWDDISRLNALYYIIDAFITERYITFMCKDGIEDLGVLLGEMVNDIQKDIQEIIDLEIHIKKEPKA